jgi:hypothetical protein
MKKVYIVLQDDDFEPCKILGVFYNKEDAEKSLDDYKKLFYDSEIRESEIE